MDHKRAVDDAAKMIALIYEGIIFDLDMTLVDSRCVAHHRARYQWQKALGKVPQITPYPGILELTSKITKKGVATAIVTSSKRDYCDRVVTHCKLPIKTSVAYGDTKLHKPHPEPLLHAASLLNLKPQNIVVIGDRSEDIAAANSAGMTSIAAMWACTAPLLIKDASPQYECKTVLELTQLLGFN